MMSNERELMQRAIAEIESLRRQVERLGAYHDHTERMLAIFEGGPRQPSSVGMSEDVVWFMRRFLAETDPKNIAQNPVTT